MRILVAEDHPDVAELFKVVLEVEGHECTVVESGFKELLDPREWEDIGGALLDYRLEGPVTGLDLAYVARDSGVSVIRLITATDVSPELQTSEFPIIIKPASTEQIRAPFRNPV